MTAEPAAIRPATSEDIETIAGVLAAAFEDDPLYEWFVRDDRPRLEVLRAFFREEAQQYLASGETYVTAEGNGAALWKPAPGAQPSSLRSLIGALPYLRRMTGVRKLPRLWRLIRLTEARYPQTPHCYLYLIGVRPEAQGSGVGSTLLRPVLERLDENRTPAYLESSKERNVPFYERHGFRTVERLDLPRGPSMWLMWRE